MQYYFLVTQHYTRANDNDNDYDNDNDRDNVNNKNITHNNGNHIIKQYTIMISCFVRQLSLFKINNSENV